MAISYHVYANDGQGGPVDYSKPVATTSGTSQAIGPLAAPSDNTFAVRAFDEASGIEEANTVARARVVIDAAGRDVSARPNAVIGLAAGPVAGGGCWVSWCYQAKGQGDVPARFLVEATPGPTPPAAGPPTTVDYLPGVVGYGCTLAGLADGVTTITVRAVGATGQLAGAPATVAVHYRVAPLGDVDSLAAVASP